MWQSHFHITLFFLSLDLIYFQFIQFFGISQMCKKAMWLPNWMKWYSEPQYPPLMFHNAWNCGGWQCPMAYGCSGLCRQPIMCRVLTMFHLAWMCRWSVLASVSWHIYVGYNSVPCEQMVSCMPKNTPGACHLQLRPQILVHENDNILGD